MVEVYMSPYYRDISKVADEFERKVERQLRTGLLFYHNMMFDYLSDHLEYIPLNLLEENHEIWRTAAAKIVESYARELINFNSKYTFLGLDYYERFVEQLNMEIVSMYKKFLSYVDRRNKLSPQQDQIDQRPATAQSQPTPQHDENEPVSDDADECLHELLRLRMNLRALSLRSSSPAPSTSSTYSWKSAISTDNADANDDDEDSSLTETDLIFFDANDDDGDSSLTETDPILSDTNDDDGESLLTESDSILSDTNDDDKDNSLTETNSVLSDMNDDGDSSLTETDSILSDANDDDEDNSIIENNPIFNNRFKVPRKKLRPKCCICGRIFRSIRKLDTHLNWHHDKKEVEASYFQCPLKRDCRRCFTKDREIDYRNHLQGVHREVISTMLWRPKVLVCDVCNAHFNSASAFYDHLYAHSRYEQPFICPIENYSEMLQNILLSKPASVNDFEWKVMDVDVNWALRYAADK